MRHRHLAFPIKFTGAEGAAAGTLFTTWSILYVQYVLVC